MLAGMAGAHAAYLASVIVFSYSYPSIRGVKEVLALLPVISDIRGDIMGSSASRMITALHLGLLKPSASELLRAEAPNVAAAVVTTSLLISLFVAGWYALLYAEILDVNTTIAVSFLASLLITVIVLPGVAYSTASLFARGIDPGNVMPTLVTVVTDLVSIPSLVLVYVALSRALGSDAVAVLSLLFATLSVAVATAVLLHGGLYARIFRERLSVVGLVIAGQAVAGVLLAGFEEKLAGSGVIHVTPAFIGLAGALASIAGLKMAIHVYIHGYQRLEHTMLSTLLDNIVVGVVSVIPLGLIGYATAGGGIQQAPLPALLLLLAASMTAVVLAAAPVAYALVRLSFRAGVMPENVLLPVLTTFVDALGIVVLAVAGESLIA